MFAKRFFPLRTKKSFIWNSVSEDKHRHKHSTITISHTHAADSERQRNRLFFSLFCSVFFFRLQSDLCARRYSRRHLTLCRRVFCLCSWFFFYISFSVIVVCFGTRCTISDIVRAPDRILSRDLCINLVYHHHLVFSEFNPNFVPSIKSRIENEFEWKEIGKKLWIRKVQRQFVTCSSMSATIVAAVRWFFGAVELHSTRSIFMDNDLVFFLLLVYKFYFQSANGRNVNELKSFELKKKWKVC